MKGFIYKITCGITGEFYIGSTKSVKKRINQHLKGNTSASQILKRDKYIVETLEEVEVESKRDLHRIEADYIKSFISDKCVNKIMPFRSDEEKREYKKNYQKQEHVKIYAKNYYHKYYAELPLTLCPCGGRWRSISNRNKHFKSAKHQNYESGFKKITETLEKLIEILNRKEPEESSSEYPDSPEESSSD